MQPQIEIRDIESSAEIRLVEDLQKEVWGLPDMDVVPLSQLTAATHAGGTLIGAFDGTDLVGFAYGFAAVEDGKHAHHSHMLAVRKEYRKHDLGFRLKAAQRERVLGQGIDMMSWTFDPLQSLNAYFNFAKLGVIAEKYFVDFYGSDAGSFLHQNGTDRLWVTWELTSNRVVDRLRRENDSREPGEFFSLVKCGENERPIRRDFENDAALAIEIPVDISSTEAADTSLAAEWRHATREAFVAAIEKGFYIKDFYRMTRSGRPVGVYVLNKK